MSLSRFADRRLQIVSRLAQGEAGGGHVEACILAGATLSGLAAYAWPGKIGDHNRFAEAWVQFAEPALSSVRVSLPLLIDHLRKKGDLEEARILERQRVGMFGPGYSCRVVTGEDVDLTEQEVRSLCPSVKTAELRKFSYPSVFYSEVRSSAVHEYQFSDRATNWPMTTRDAGVSYSNLLVDGRTERQIYFHIPWLISVISSIANNMDRAPVQGSLPVPSSWWREGQLFGCQTPC